MEVGSPFPRRWGPMPLNSQVRQAWILAHARQDEIRARERRAVEYARGRARALLRLDSMEWR